MDDRVNDHADLVARLRRLATDYTVRSGQPRELMSDAADALDALTNERDELANTLTMEREEASELIAELQGCWRNAEAERGAALAELALWKKLAVARAGILAAYRTGGRVPGKHIDAAVAAEKKLRELHEEVADG